MEMVKMLKIRIYPGENDKSLLIDSMHAYVAGCNYVSEYVYTSENLSAVSVQKEIYHQIRKAFSLPAQMACNVVRQVAGAYKTVRENGHEWTKCRFRSPVMTLSWNRDYSLNNERFSIGTLNGRIRVDYARAGIEQYFDKSVYRFGAGKIIYRHGKFYLYVSVKYDVDELNDENVTKVIGHDRGIRFLVTSYDSDGKTSFVSGNEVKQKRAHYKLLRKQLQKKGTPSARRRLKSIGQRENRWMSDVNHRISKALVESNPKGTLHVLEDLKGIRSATERVCVRNRYVSVSWAYYDLEQKLTYKALEHGQKVIKVDPRYTSQRCPVCGHTEKGNRNKEKHVFCCRQCGYTSNDDRTGAMNIYRKGIEYLSKTHGSHIPA